MSHYRSRLRQFCLAACSAVLLVSAGCATDSAHSTSQVAYAASSECPKDGSVLDVSSSYYGRQMNDALGREIFYPPQAIATGQAGSLIACVMVRADGYVKEAHVSTSSGFPLLDGAALVSIGRFSTPALHFLSVPDEFLKGADHAWLSVPVQYTLKDNTGQKVAPNIASDCARPEASALAKASASERAVFDEFNRQFQNDLSQALAYPSSAAARREEGRALLCLHVDPQGHILASQVAKSSGDPLFDGASLIAVGLVALQYGVSLPSHPPGIDTTFFVPVSWQM